jgi:hypothetical protein
MPPAFGGTTTADDAKTDVEGSIREGDAILVRIRATHGSAHW